MTQNTLLVANFVQQSPAQILRYFNTANTQLIFNEPFYAYASVFVQVHVHICICAMPCGVLTESY